MASAYLFDASAVVDVLLGGSAAGVDFGVLFDEHMLDLTKYEAGNALWKTGVARNKLSESELADAVEILDQLEQEMVVETSPGDDLSGTMQMAQDSGLTFYDASYLAAAQRGNLVLVTEDSALRTAADGLEVATARVGELA